MDKDMIVFEESRLDNLIRLLDKLVWQSELEENNNGYQSPKKFELGTDIVLQLKEEGVRYIEPAFKNPFKDEKLMFMGIPVEVNRDVPDMIKLWKEVKL